MTIPRQFQQDADHLPVELRALLAAELEAGNEVTIVGHSFPAPPVGAYFLLARPVTTRPRQSGDGLVFRDYGSSLYSGGFTDAQGFFHILEAPLPAPEEPDMDAIREAHNPPWTPPEPAPPSQPAPPAPTPLSRFEESMAIDYEKWHDGIGYDLSQIELANAEERKTIEMLVVFHKPRGWRDVEALAALDTPRTRQTLRETLEDGDAELRAAVLRYAPGVATPIERTESIVRALQTAAPYAGLSQTLDQVAEHHPAEVIDALLRNALTREGAVACHLAAMLMYVHGKAAEPFDWAQRPFFLRFNTEDRGEREQIFRELCEKIEVDPAAYLTTGRKRRGRRKPG